MTPRADRLRLKVVLLSGLALLAPAALTACARPTIPVIAAMAGSAAGETVPEPAAVVAASSDPLSARLVFYLRLLTPGGGSATEIAGFLHDNPDWPNRTLLLRRLDQALGSETDAAVLGRLCAGASLDSAQSLLRCAGASLPVGPEQSGSTGLLALTVPPAIAQAARSAWVQGLDQPDQAAEFLHVWGHLLTPADDWARFDRLEWGGNVAAAGRLVPLLAPAQQPLAIARLALRRNDVGADGIAAALQADAARDPALVLDLARWYRRADRSDEALSLWRTRGFDAEQQAPASRLAAFWAERDALARDLLRDHRDADGFLVADDAYQTTPATLADAAFLTGWIALRRLHDPAAAEARFTRLLGSDAAITRSRGAYWTGRARLARGDPAGGRAALDLAASFPTTFYGQLALARLQGPPPGMPTLLDPSLDRPMLADRLAHLHDPRWSSAQAIDFAGLELARAAETLVAWNDPRHARAFLLKLDQLSGSDTDHALAASLADRLGLPDVAVAIARSAGRHGLVLSETGWPRPFTPPASPVLPPGLALAIMRQESSFDAQITSPVGARGLMQLTSGTARDTARGLGRPDLAPAAGSPNTLFDPEVNLVLGTAYLAGLLDRFHGVLPYAVAAYNAGPHRVDRWLADNGDPASEAAPAGNDNDAQDRMIDWIELIPFAETRNYVQRVMENMGVYQSGPGGRA
ncbi:transglycosylase SLT domain-containing protein [Lichenicola sp.]|uniref:lytic transglycosylase domain-containing protein n=1 Tax=Lichenicola sp. TaxID=2804529 RepID=UPI003AFFD52E